MAQVLREHDLIEQIRAINDHYPVGLGCKDNERLKLQTGTINRVRTSAQNESSIWNIIILRPFLEKVAELDYGPYRPLAGLNILGQLAPYGSRPSSGMPPFMHLGKSFRFNPMSDTSGLLWSIAAAPDSWIVPALKWVARDLLP